MKTFPKKKENKKITFALMGNGRFGRHYERILNRRSDTFLKYIVTRQSKYSLDDVTKDPEIDACVIATPASTHLQILEKIALSKKHIFVEKPLVLTQKELDKIKEIKNDKILMVGYIFVFNNYIRHIKKLLDKEVVGKLIYIMADNLYPGPIRQDTGSFEDSGTHEMSILHFLFPNLKINKSSLFQKNKNGKDIFSNLSLELDNPDCFFTLRTNSFSPKKERRMWFAGEKGIISFDDMAPSDEKITILKSPFPKFPKEDKLASATVNTDKKTNPKIKHSEPLAEEIGHFIQSIKKNKSTETDIDFAEKVTQTVINLQTGSARYSSKS